VRPVPPFTERHEALRAEMRAFVEGELRPLAPEWEAARCFPDEVFGMLAERGWLGLKYGPDADWVADAVLCEELPRAGSGGLAAGIGAHTGIATPPLATFGTEAQQRRWLEPAIRGEKIAALAITEPDTGSDVAAIRTRAERVDGGWVVNGAKTFITNGVRADFYVTAVRTRAEPGHGSLSFLVVEAGEGVSARPLEKLGWHASDTAEIAFEDVAVPDDALLGEEGRGFYLIVANFQWERLLMSLGAVGSMRATLERVIAILGDRGCSQAVRHRVAGLAVSAEAGAALTYHALRRFLDGARHSEAAGDEASGRGSAMREVTMAKLATQRANFELQDACYGVLADLGHEGAHDLARAARDARLGPIGGGTDEIMKEILGKTMGL
jgi:acyl-CoA dehydrogenase